MRCSIQRTLLLALLLTLMSHSAFAQSQSIRAEKPISVLVELSVGGPNGTIGGGLSYDFLDWGGVTLGAGYSAFTESINTSVMFNARPWRGGSAQKESALQLSLGTSYRGQSKREEDSLWGGQTTTYTADHTVFVSSAIGYALACRNGFRFNAYLGWDFPVSVSNYGKYSIDEDGDRIEKDESKSLAPDKGLNNFWPSIGISFGKAF